MTELNSQKNIVHNTDSQIRSEKSIDSHSRSLIKGISWRIIASLTTVFIAWIVTGDTALALEIGAFEVVAKVFIYYGHERIWLSI